MVKRFPKEWWGGREASTIDSFFKQIVTEEGSHLGYAHSIRVRSFIMERNQIIHDALDAVLSKMRKENPDMPYYPSLFQYGKAVRKIWETLSSRGYFPQKDTDLDMGGADNGDGRRINAVLKEAVLSSIRKYEEGKKEQDALDIGDIKEEMDRLTRSDLTRFQELSLRYLFVDEFQDTDNSQIQSIVWLVQKLGCCLLAVGDVKQSIYRFRGASDTAFDELEGAMRAQGAVVHEHSLRINYRSDPRILAELNRYFAKWNDQGYLSYNQADHVEAGLPPDYRVKTPVDVVEADSDDGKYARFVADVKKLREERPGDSICVLCRNNYDVTDCARMLRKQAIPCHAKLRGGFYSTPPVNDLYALLGALLYPTDPVRLFNFLLSSYADTAPLDAAALSGRAGEPQAILSYLEGLRDGKDPGEWKAVMQAVQTRPAFDFLRQYAEKHDPVEGYFRHVAGPSAGTREEQEYKLEQYQLNLDKLFRLLYEHFAGDFPTLDDIYSYLTILRTTGDTSEDALYPSDDRTEAVLVMTVHKAKGLEFDHVFLPFLEDHIYRPDNAKAGYTVRVLTEGSGLPVRLGWHFFMADRSGSQPETRVYENSYYGIMAPGEADAILGEETRVFYVALTRACHSLHLYILEEKDGGLTRLKGPENWDHLLRMGEE